MDSEAQTEEVVVDPKAFASWILKPVVIASPTCFICLASPSASILVYKRLAYTCLKLLLAAGQPFYVVLLQLPFVL